MQQQPAHHLYFDLETLPTNIEQVRNRITTEATTKRPANNVARAKKAEWDTELGRNARISEALDKTAVDPLLARPIVAAFAFDAEPVQTLWLEPEPTGEGDDLHPVELVWFDSFCEGMSQLAKRFDARVGSETTWIGFNSNGFDLGILLNSWRRAAVAIPTHFPRYLGRGWRGKTYDAMTRVPCSNGLGYVSLDACCEAFGLGSAKCVDWNGLPMDGSRVKAAYDAGEKDLLLEYCASDVDMLRQLVDVLTESGAYTDQPPRADIANQIAQIRRNAGYNENQKNVAIISLLTASGTVPGL
jgi:hypothetical protein